MIQRRRKAEFDKRDFGSFRAIHHFVTGGPTDNPKHQPIGSLVAWNDDEIPAGQGIDFHPHANMEIITYLREGTIQHRDSLGQTGMLSAGDVQVMSAGTGLMHAEMATLPAKIFQIWITPRQRGGEPTSRIRRFPKEERAGRFVVLASGFESDADALPIRADARVAASMLKAGQIAEYQLKPTRKAYLVSSRGSHRHQRRAVRGAGGRRRAERSPSRRRGT